MGNSHCSTGLKPLRQWLLHLTFTQEPFLFSTTVLQNVLYGLPDHILLRLNDTEKQERVVEACKLANAPDFIQALPNVNSYGSFQFGSANC